MHILLRENLYGQLTKKGFKAGGAGLSEPEGKRGDRSLTVTLNINGAKFSLLNHLNGEIQNISFYDKNGKKAELEFSLETDRFGLAVVTPKESFEGTVVYDIFNTEPERIATVDRRYRQPAPFKIEYPPALEKKLKEWEKLPAAQKVERLKEWIRVNLQYDDGNPESVKAYKSFSGPLVNFALKYQKVDCDVANTVFAAILRTRWGIPARLAAGFLVQDGAIKDTKHAWIEVFYNGQWRTFDATPPISEPVAEKESLLDKIDIEKQKPTPELYFSLRKELLEQSEYTHQYLHDMFRGIRIIAKRLGNSYEKDAYIIIKYIVLNKVVSGSPINHYISAFIDNWYPHIKNDPSFFETLAKQKPQYVHFFTEHIGLVSSTNLRLCMTSLELFLQGKNNIVFDGYDEMNLIDNATGFILAILSNKDIWKKDQGFVGSFFIKYFDRLFYFARKEYLKNHSEHNLGCLWEAVNLNGDPSRLEPLFDFIVKTNDLKIAKDILSYRSETFSSVHEKMLNWVLQSISLGKIDRWEYTEAILEYAGKLNNQEQEKLAPFMQKILKLLPSPNSSNSYFMKKENLYLSFFLMSLPKVPAMIETLKRIHDNINKYKKEPDKYDYFPFSSIQSFWFAKLANQKEISKLIFDLVSVIHQKFEIASEIAEDYKNWTPDLLVRFSKHKPNLAHEIYAKRLGILTENIKNENLRNELRMPEEINPKEIEEPLIALQILPNLDKKAARDAVYLTLSSLQYLFCLNKEVKSAKAIAANLAALVKKAGFGWEEVMAFADHSADRYTQQHLSQSEYVFWSNALTQFLKSLPFEKQYLPIKKMWRRLEHFDKRLITMLPALSSMNYEYYNPDSYDEKLERAVSAAIDKNIPKLRIEDRYLIASRLLAKQKFYFMLSDQAEIFIESKLALLGSGPPKFSNEEKKEFVSNLTKFIADGFSKEIRKNEEDDEFQMKLESYGRTRHTALRRKALLKIEKITGFKLELDKKERQNILFTGDGPHSFIRDQIDPLPR